MGPFTLSCGKGSVSSLPEDFLDSNMGSVIDQEDPHDTEELC